MKSTPTVAPFPPPDELMLPPECPYFGFRDITRLREDGTTVDETVALTEADILHPEEGDHIVERGTHREEADYLWNAFKNRLSTCPGTVILCNQGIEFHITDMKYVVPDVAVIFNVSDPTVDYLIFDVVEEGTRPNVVIEITSPSTRRNDFLKKFDIYHRGLVPIYIIIDIIVRKGERRARLLPYKRGPKKYRLEKLDAQGRYYLKDLDLWLGLENDYPALYDPITNERIGNYQEMVKNLEAARLELRREQRRANRLEAENAKLRERLKQLENPQRHRNGPAPNS